MASVDLNQLEHPQTDDQELLLGRLRSHRDRLLAECDWAMLEDAPTDKTAWAAYRQALRDLPATWTPGSTAEFPDTP